jgi:hypothetical protein
LDRGIEIFELASLMWLAGFDWKEAEVHMKRHRYPIEIMPLFALAFAECHRRPVERYFYGSGWDIRHARG